MAGWSAWTWTASARARPPRSERFSILRHLDDNAFPRLSHSKDPLMKLLRHGPLGQEKPGALDADGQPRDLSLLVPDFTPEWLAPEKLRALAAIDLKRMPLVPQGARLGVPVAGTRQF